MIIKGNTTTITLNTGLDLTTYSVFEIGYRDPENNEGTWTASVSGSATDGKIETTQTLDLDGLWTVWSIVDGSKGYTTVLQVVKVPRDELDYIVDLAFVKKYLGLETNDYDFKIEQLIPVVHRDYQTIANISFSRRIYRSEDYFYREYYPEGSNVVAAEMIAYKLFGRSPEDGYRDIESESLGSYSVSYGGTTPGSYPKSITSSIRKYIGFIS